MALDELRAEIDRADQELSAAFARRMEIAARIAAYKRENGLPVLDQRREDAVAAPLQAVIPCAMGDCTAFVTHSCAPSSTGQ